MNEIELWDLFPKQREALELIDSKKFTLLIGQGRASKSMLAVVYLIRRAWQHPGTNHCIFRNTLQSALDGLWLKTLPEALTHFFPGMEHLQGFSINKSLHAITLPNGSRIMVRGLDNPSKAAKVLSQQFATILIDEVQTVDYLYFSLLLTRLPKPADGSYTPRAILTANWCPKTHWSHAFFKEGLNPVTRVPHHQNCAYLKFQTVDNRSVDATEYIDTLIHTADRASRLACASDDWFTTIEGALWQPGDIPHEAQPEQLPDRIIVSFDPATTNTKTSDAHGICVLAKYGPRVCVLECLSLKAAVEDAAKAAVKLYHNYKASRIVYENNQGGDWVPALIKAIDLGVYCEKVNARASKMVRAEPIAAMYKHGVVFHAKYIPQLENEMCEFNGTGESPNSLDAMVHGVQHLTHTRYADPNKI